MQPVKDQRRYVLLTASRIYSLRFLLSLCLLTASISSCKKAADAQPDWATAVVGTYKGKLNGNTTTVLITREDNALLTVTLTEAKSFGTYTYVFKEVKMTSATAFSGGYGYYISGSSSCSDVAGSFGGGALSISMCTSYYTFTGSK